MHNVLKTPLQNTTSPSSKYHKTHIQGTTKHLFKVPHNPLQNTTSPSSKYHKTPLQSTTHTSSIAIFIAFVFEPTSIIGVKIDTGAESAEDISGSFKDKSDTADTTEKRCKIKK